MEPTGPPESRETPTSLRAIREEIRKSLVAARKLLVAAFLLMPVVAYLGYWNVKEYGRRLMSAAALSIISIYLVSEVALYVAGPDRMLKLLEGVKSSSLSIALQVVFACVAVILFRHNWKEIRHKKTDQSFARALWRLLQERGGKDELEFANLVLSLVKDALSEFGVVRICLWWNNENKILSSGCIFPRDARFDSPPFYIDIASHVLNDNSICYVPRFGFPFNSGVCARFCWYFSHALMFTRRPNADGIQDIDNPKIKMWQGNRNQSWWKWDARSFIVVPLKANGGPNIGIMSIDFRRTDPLIREQMKIADSLATLIAEELSKSGTMLMKADQ